MAIFVSIKYKYGKVLYGGPGEGMVWYGGPGEGMVWYGGPGEGVVLYGDPGEGVGLQQGVGSTSETCWLLVLSSTLALHSSHAWHILFA